MREFFSKQFLGLPMYAWAIGLGVTALAIIYFLRQKSNSSSTSGTGTDQTGSSQGTYISTTVPVPYPTTSPQPTGPSGIKAPGIPPGIGRSNVEDFPNWLSGALTGTRPDILAGIQQNRWADVTGEYAKEVYGQEQANVAQFGTPIVTQSQVLGAQVQAA